MIRKIVTLALIISLAVSLLLAGGCFNAGEKLAEKITEGAIEKAIEDETGADVNISEGSVTMKTDEGETTIGSGADIPEGFPEGEVPIYPDMEIVTSSKFTHDGKDSFSIIAESEDTSDKIVDWYKGQLGGWNIDSEFASDSAEGKTSMISASKDNYNLTLFCAEDQNGLTHITLGLDLE